MSVVALVGKKIKGSYARTDPLQVRSGIVISALFPWLPQYLVQVVTGTVGSVLQGRSRQVGIALGDLAVGMPQDLLDFVERPARVD